MSIWAIKSIAEGKQNTLHWDYFLRKCLAWSGKQLRQNLRTQVQWTTTHLFSVWTFKGDQLRWFGLLCIWCVAPPGNLHLITRTKSYVDLSCCIFASFKKHLVFLTPPPASFLQPVPTVSLWFAAAEPHFLSFPVLEVRVKSLNFESVTI